MAFIGFSHCTNGASSIHGSGFENGFEVKRQNNSFHFSGEWNCPVSPAPDSYTQNLVCVCAATSNCVMITASYAFCAGKATVNGWMTITPSLLPFANSGIDEIARNGGPIHIFHSGATGPDTCISAPYFDGQILVSSF